MGCGAVGSLFAANLAQLDDVEVWAYDVSRAHVDAINTNGLRLTGAGDVLGHPRATTDAAELPECDFGIVATKAMHTEGAIAATAHAFVDGAVATVQNGVGNEEVVAAHVARVIRGTTFPAGKILEPGVVQWDVKGDTTLGPFEPKPAGADEIARLADACTRGGMPASAVSDARPAQWRKVIFNASTNPIGALTGLTHGRVCERPDLRAIVSALVDEGKAVASAQGIVLDADPEDLIDHAARPEVAYDHKASMLQDVEARRATEIDFLNGGIARFGRELGVPTPLNDAITRLVKGLEASWVDTLSAELERRHTNVRAAMAAHDLDALIVSGSEYSGFEGAVTYMSGFQIVHRYAYVVVPADGEPHVVFPSEARYVGEHGTSELEQVFHDRPGEVIASRARDAGWRRIGVFGLDYIMAVRDYRALDGLDLVPFDVEFDHARAVKSDDELESVRDSVRINERGFEIFLETYAPGKTAAEVMAAAEEWFVAEGCGRLTMNMVLTGTDTFARPEFKIARREEVLGDFLLPSLEVAGPGMHWVEVSRAIAARDAVLSDDTARMLEAYLEYYDATRDAMRPGASCHDVHRAVSAGFTQRGYHLGHVTGHSIGMTMIEFPKVGEGVETELAENMVFSMHPHAIAANGEDCLYMQDTWLVTADGGVPLSNLPMQVFRAP